MDGRAFSHNGQEASNVPSQPLCHAKKAKELFGEFADDACLDHIGLDRTPASKWIMPPPKKKAVDLEHTKIALQNLFKEMFHTMEEFPNLAIWKKEAKVQKKPKSGLGSWLQILLVLAALSGLAD